jgi:hypothetical protein
MSKEISQILGAINGTIFFSSDRSKDLFPHHETV